MSLKEEGENDASNESSRIAILTTGAINVSGEKVIKDIEELVLEAADNMEALRIEADRVIANIKRDTLSLAERVTMYVEDCKSAVETVKGLRLTNGSGAPVPGND